MHHLIQTVFVMLFASPIEAAPGYITFPADVDWVVRESTHFRVIYRRGSEEFGSRVIHCAEKAHTLLTPYFPQAPEKTWIVLADWQDSTNGYALNIPYSHMVIFAAPPESTGQLPSLDDWLFSIILHEYVHILHIYATTGLWKPIRSVFGNIILPVGLVPTHLHEGLAVLLETELLPGGRGHGTTFTMYQRMAVEEGVWGTDAFLSLDQLEGSNIRYPHGATRYFFGYTLYKELWSRKKQKGIYDLTLSYSSQWPGLLNEPLQEVYGVDYQSLWKDIFRKTREETEREIKVIKSEPLPSLKYLSQSKFSKWDLAVSKGGKRLAYRKADPIEGSTINIIDLTSGFLESGTTKTEIREKGIPFSEGLCWTLFEKRELLILVKPVTKYNYTTNQLVILEEEKRTVVLDPKLNNIHRVACSPDTENLVIYQEKSGVGYVKELSWDGKNQKLKVSREWKIPEGTWVSSLAASIPHWFLLREGANTSLFRWELDRDPVRVLSVRGHFYSMRLKKDTGEIWAIGTPDGRDELWSISPRTGETKKRVALLGGTNSFDWAGENVILTSYRHGGYDLALAKPLTAKPVRLIPSTPSTPRESLPKVNLSQEVSYSAWKSLPPKSWIPQTLFVPDGIQVGAWIPGFDVTQRHFYDIYGGYDTRGAPFLDTSYSFRMNQSLTLAARGYFSPTYLQSSRTFFKTWGFGVAASTELDFISTEISLGPIIRQVEPIDTLGRGTNRSVGASLRALKSFGFDKRPLSISSISGTRLLMSHSQYFKALGSRNDYFTSTLGFDQYLEAPWKREQVLYLAGRGAYTQDPDVLSSSFEAGGELLFGMVRGAYLNRGFSPGAFLATRLFNLNLEYRFPISRIDKGYGLTPLFFKNLHGALILDLTTYDRDRNNPDPPNLFKNYFGSVGAEIKTDWTFFYYLPAHLRLGFYRGFGEVASSEANVSPPEFAFALGIEASLF